MGNEDKHFPPVKVSFRNSKLANGTYEVHYHNLEILSKEEIKYAVIPAIYCKGHNDQSYKEVDGVKVVEDCLQRCNAYPACISAEFLDSDPIECQISTTCTKAHAEPAPPEWNSSLYVKEV